MNSPIYLLQDPFNTKQVPGLISISLEGLSSLKDGLVVDLSKKNHQDKRKLFQTIPSHLSVISDLSFSRPQELLKEFPFLTAGVCSYFPGPKKKIECLPSPGVDHYHLEKILSFLSLTPHYLRNLTSFFIYPRLLCMIALEAQLALKEGVADQENIDQAMINGVNYPEGPFAMIERIGKENIAFFLQQLQYLPEKNRYKDYSLFQGSQP